MRKKIIFMIMLLSGISLRAQVEKLATVQLDDVIRNTIIRNYSGGLTVSYIETITQGYFALSDNESYIKMAELDNDYKVYDLEIFADTVVFCGEHLLESGSKGFVGWFACPSIWGAGVFHIMENFHAQTPNNNLCNVNCFKDIVAYIAEDPHYRNMAVVGETDSNYACVVEMTGSFSLNSWIYSIGCPPTTNERMDHIVVTENYVVTGGFPFQSYTGVELRVFLRYSMFPYYFSNIGDVQYFYPFYTALGTAWCYPMVDFQMTATRGDSIGTISFMSKNVNTLGFNGIITHVFDADATTNGPDGTPCPYNSYVSIANSQGMCGTHRVTYNSALSELIGLARTNLTSGLNTTAFGEFTIPSSGSMLYSYVNKYKFYCHDNLSSHQGIVALGNNTINSQELVFYTKPLLVSNLHCGVAGYAVTDEGCFLKKHLDLPLTVKRDILEFTPVDPLGIVEKELERKCY